MSNKSNIIANTNEEKAKKLIDMGFKRFVASYSCGKDSALALYRAIQSGLEPISLITTYNIDKNHSWFHAVPKPLLVQISKSLKINIKLIKTNGEEYLKNFEAELSKFKKDGAQICIFGDIDIEEHIQWCTDRCEKVGVEPFFPLYKESRLSLVYEFIDSGFKTHITTIDTSRMDGKLLGKQLTRSVVEELIGHGVDPCGENGEYHTFTYDGPLFHKPIIYRFGNIQYNGKYVRLPLEY